MANYDATSPYFNTGYSQFFLDVMVDRPFPQESDDLKFKLNLTYQYRPDLLAHDLYGDARLWWVFYQRNRARSGPCPMLPIWYYKQIRFRLG